MRWTARTDPLEYWACLSLSETEGEEVAERARTRWADIAAYNLVPAEVFQWYLDHDVLDSDEGHGALCAEPFAEAPPLTPGQQERIQDTVVAYASTWLLNADEILSFTATRTARSATSRRSRGNGCVRPVPAIGVHSER